MTAVSLHVSVEVGTFFPLWKLRLSEAELGEGHTVYTSLSK